MHLETPTEPNNHVRRLHIVKRGTRTLSPNPRENDSTRPRNLSLTEPKKVERGIKHDTVGIKAAVIHAASQEVLVHPNLATVHLQLVHIFIDIETCFPKAHSQALTPLIVELIEREGGWLR